MYQPSSAVKKRAPRERSRSSGERTRRNRAASIGTRVSATSSEQARANTTTRASAWNRAPLVVRVNTTGRKMTQVVSVEAMIAPATSRAPTFAASSAGRSCSSRFRTMLSSTTMALSTISPTPRASPPKVIWLSVRPAK